MPDPASPVVSDGVSIAAWLIDGAQTIRTNTTAAGTSKVTALTLAGSNNTWTGSLDLKNNTLIVEPADTLTKANDLATLQNQITFGSTHTAGIRDSALPASTALALLDNNVTQFSTFHGAIVDSNSLLIAPELLGDANADGKVDLTDLNTVLNNLGTSTPAWTSGNFDHASTIDLTDLNTVLNNLGTSVITNGTFNQSTIPTPEPASLCTLSISLLVLRRRPSRNS